MRSFICQNKSGENKVMQCGIQGLHQTLSTHVEAEECNFVKPKPKKSSHKFTDCKKQVAHLHLNFLPGNGSSPRDYLLLSSNTFKFTKKEIRSFPKRIPCSLRLGFSSGFRFMKASKEVKGQAQNNRQDGTRYKISLIHSASCRPLSCTKNLTSTCFYFAITCNLQK